MRVLVVEDSRTEAARLQKVLAAGGWDVEIVTNGPDALKRCEEPAIDALVSDVVMPDMDGYALCRAVRSSDLACKSVPILLLTSLEDPIQVLHALAAGATSFMSKPYDPDRLRERLGKLVVQRELDPEDSALEVQGILFRLDVSKARLIRVLGAVLEDAIERNRALEESRSDLERAQRRRHHMIQFIGHDLRGPMSHLSLKATLADDDEEHLRTLPQVVRTQLDTMQRLLTDLTDVTSIELGDLEVAVFPVDMAPLIESVIAAERGLDDGHRLELSLAPDLVAMVDARRFAQIIQNLLTNAIKYSPDGGTIRVSGVRDGDEVRISVSDEGIGIEAEALPHIFEPYYRADSGRDVARGSGIGLYTVRELLHLQGGRVDVETTVGKGSTFTVSVPAARGGRSGA